MSALLLSAVCLLAAGCGDGGSRSAASRDCAKTGAARAVAHLRRDIAAIHRAALTVRPGQTFNGNAAVGEATDRFLLDVGTAPISNLRRNRLIDHAASALVSSCEQCFQALEAQRPIVTIKFRPGACGA